MKERPILFSGAMVRAILDGRKTQTRRVMKPQPSESFLPEVGAYCPTLIDKRDGEMYPGPECYGASDADQDFTCPYGQPGDRLWVRETWQAHLCIAADRERIHYRAGGESCSHDGERIKKWRPSIFMARWDSRITLEIVSVRVERVQEVSEEDAKAEGVSGYDCEQYRAEFCDLWDSINAKCGYPFNTNPWVWVVKFRKL